VAGLLDEHTTYKAHGTDVRSTLNEPLLFSYRSASKTSLLDTFTNDLIIAGTSRWPSMYVLEQLHTSITVLFVAVAVVSIIQLIAAGIFKLVKRDAVDLPK
jgi:hypothetical protein